MMDVYYNGNGNIWGRSRQGKKLSAFPIRSSFLWEEQEILIPAVYVGSSGVILDVCAKIPPEDMLSFLKKWDKKRRLSLKTLEDYEQLEADNPSCGDFKADMSLNGQPLALRMSASLVWYSEEIFKLQTEEAPDATVQDFDAHSPGRKEISEREEWVNDKWAEKLMTAYSCDRECCWHFGRLAYHWSKEPVLSPREISLSFQVRPSLVTAEHFTTALSCNGEKVKAVHPQTGIEYTITLHGCSQNKVSFAHIGAENVRYPEYCQFLSYSTSPEIPPDFLSIRDCAESDQPQVIKTAYDELSAEGHEPTALFQTGRDSIPGRHTACSSLHFEPVSEIQWRVIFQIKNKKDMEICFPICPHSSTL